MVSFAINIESTIVYSDISLLPLVLYSPGYYKVAIN